MQYAQDPKAKAPTMVELVSDLSLRFHTLDHEHVEADTSLIGVKTELATLASVLFTITGHEEWQSLGQHARDEAMRARVRLERQTRRDMPTLSGGVAS
jgi:hypothetical protein